MKASLSFTLLVLAATASGADAQQQQRRTPTEAAEPARSECISLSEPGKIWQGQAFAIDGTVMAGVGLRPHLRLWGIQTADLRDKQSGQETVAGMRARAALADLLARSDHKIKCRVMRFDRPACHLVVQCSLDDPQAGDLGGAMIASGMAYGLALEDAPPWEPRAAQRYADAEVEARKAKRGLWPAWLGEK